MEDIVTRLRRAVDNEPFMLGGEHDLLKDALREITTLLGCCDGAAAQDAHVRQERAEHKAEIEKLRADRRERIATAALPGLLSKWGGTPQQAADFAIQYADALIAKLDKEEGKP